MHKYKTFTASCKDITVIWRGPITIAGLPQSLMAGLFASSRRRGCLIGLQVDLPDGEAGVLKPYGLRPAQGNKAEAWGRGRWADIANELVAGAAHV